MVKDGSVRDSDGVSRGLVEDERKGERRWASGDEGVRRVGRPWEGLW